MWLPVPWPVRACPVRAWPLVLRPLPLPLTFWRPLAPWLVLLLVPWLPLLWAPVLLVPWLPFRCRGRRLRPLGRAPVDEGDEVVMVGFSVRGGGR